MRSQPDGRNSYPEPIRFAPPYTQAPASVQRLRNHGARTASKLALEFLIPMARRSGEIPFACWSEIDVANKLRTIPADRMNAREAHVVELAVVDERVSAMTGHRW